MCHCFLYCKINENVCTNILTVLYHPSSFSLVGPLTLTCFIGKIVHTHSSWGWIVYLCFPLLCICYLQCLWPSFIFYFTPLWHPLSTPGLVISFVIRRLTVTFLWLGDPWWFLLFKILSLVCKFYKCGPCLSSSAFSYASKIGLFFTPE